MGKAWKKVNDLDDVREVQKITNKLIKEAKQLYYNKLGEKLTDPQTGKKKFWSAFSRLTNNKKHTNIPPIIDNNKYISNFSQKTIILPISAISYIMVVFYRKWHIKQICPYIILI